MSVSVTFENQRSFNREAFLLVGGGAFAGFVTQILELVAQASHPELGALTFGAVIGLGANLADSREGTPMLRLVLSILGGVLWAGLMMTVHPLVGAAAGGLLIGAGLSLEDGATRTERFWNWSMYAVALALAAFTTGVLVPKIFVTVGLAALIFSGATWGLFLSMAAGLKRLQFTRDEVIAEFKDAEADLNGKARESMKNGRTLYQQIVRELERDLDPDTITRARSIARESARALIALLRRGAELHVASEVTSQRHLQTRVVELDERIKAATDDKVRRELEATLEELAEQLRVRNRLEVAKARIEARQERCFTALERLHVALIQSASGALGTGALDESIESLQKLSEEIRWRNLSVDELVGDDEDSAETDVESLLQQIREDSQSGTILDSAATADEPADEVTFAEEPAGTDGSVEVVEETHVQTQSSS